MRFKMNKLTAAVAVTLGTSAVVISTAQADELLYPYLVTSATVTTLVSTINIADLNFSFVPLAAGGGAPQELHYRYWYKNGANATNNAAHCVEVNKPFPSSGNDIVTFDAGGQFGNDNLGILFEDVKTSTLPDGAGRGYGNASFALLKGLTQPVRAFLVVDNNDFENALQQTAFSTAQTLAGEAIILEFQNGAAWGYQAYNAFGRYDANDVRYNQYDFSDYVEAAGEVIASEQNEGVVPIGLAPFSISGGEFRTKFFVTPISPSVWDGAAVNPVNGTLGTWVPGYQLTGDLSAALRLVIQDLSTGATGVAYDRDENPVSGQARQNVVCVGAIEAPDLLTEGARLQLPDGGWSNLRVERVRPVLASGLPDGNAIPTPEAVVIKLEYNENAPLALDSDPASPTIKGITNNAVWLRKGIKESIPRFDAAGNPIPIVLTTVGNDSNVVSSAGD